MRELTKKQLSKVKYADLSNLKDTDSFIVPKRSNLALTQGVEYLIELPDDLLVKGKNDILESNYNKGMVPIHKYIHGEVESILGQLVLFVGCYSDGKQDLPSFWRGYLPRNKVKIIKVYE